MKRGEIWFVTLDPTSGHVQSGRRRVLIVSPDAFNRVTKVPVVLPITSGGIFARTAEVQKVGIRKPARLFMAYDVVEQGPVIL
jgi:mRNA-degrading endonuclease toxin of MazEF toxin-antitoxin module